MRPQTQMEVDEQAELAELQGIVGGADLNDEAASDDDDDDYDEGPPLRKGKRTAGESSQWTMEPNGSFSATGPSVESLPPAVYELVLDNYNRMHFVTTRPLTDSLLPLDDAAQVRVVAGIRDFWTRKDIFQSRGYLYKRGILMWGPAGSGKTSIIQVLMRDLVQMGGTVILGDHPKLVTVALKEFRRIEPERPVIVVLEDVDELAHKNSEHALLALLDGEHQVQNVVYLATTNHPDKLGARIVNRPSRFDEVIKVDMPSANARRLYLQHNVPDLGTDTIERWVGDTDKFSVAHLRELVVATQCLGQKYEDVLSRLKSMCVKIKSDGDEVMGRQSSLGFEAKPLNAYKITRHEGV